jgi:protein required for attachment to host cells
MKISSGTILLIVDGAKMLLLKNEGSAACPDLKVLVHRTIDNPANREQRTDAPGVGYSSAGPERSTYEEADLHQQKEDRFAVEAASALAELAVREDGHIVVVAPPSTLSTLRHHYDRATQDKLVAEIDKDLTGHSTSHIAELVGAWTPS